MTGTDAQEAARRLAYRNGGRAHGAVPAAAVHDHAATRPIHTHHTGQHAVIDMPDPNDDQAPPVPRWRHAAHRPSPWAPAVTLAAAVLLLALVVAVTL